MALYWMAEVLPLGVTSLLPMVLFPLLDVLSAKDVAQYYMNDANFLMMGGLMVALAVEFSGLHHRAALRVMLLVGSKPRWILFGFMFVTWFL